MCSLHNLEAPLDYSEKLSNILRGLEWWQEALETGLINYTLWENMKEMDNWSVVGDDDPYSPPENRLRYLHGEVDGRYVKTSRIVEINGDIITTKNSTYKLLEPCAKYLEYLKENDIELPTEEEPIRKKRWKTT